MSTKKRSSRKKRVTSAQPDDVSSSDSESMNISRPKTNTCDSSSDSKSPMKKPPSQNTTSASGLLCNDRNTGIDSSKTTTKKPSFQKKMSASAKQVDDNNSYCSMSGESALEDEQVVEDVSPSKSTPAPESEKDESLVTRKAEFYNRVSTKMNALERDNKTSHILSDNQFETIVSFMISYNNALKEDRVDVINRYPHKIAYRWLKQYELLTVETSNVLIFKQPVGAALDCCKKVVSYGKMFDAIREIHEVEAGNDHPKSKTLYKRVSARHGKSVPRWVCEVFPQFCPVCIRSRPRKTTTAGHQPLLTRGMNVRAQIDLIDYQSMPDGPFQYVLDYQDHGIKFCQLRPLMNGHIMLLQLSSSTSSVYLGLHQSCKLILAGSSCMVAQNLDISNWMMR